MTSSSKPTILLISLAYLALNHQTSAHLLSSLQSYAILLETDSAATALQYLSSNDVKAIVLGDGELIRNEYTNLRRHIVEFAESGGIVLLASLFSSMIGPIECNRFFRDPWGLQWKSGSYERTVYHVNPLRGHGLDVKDLPESYSQKAVSLKHVAIEDRVYIPTTESWTQYLVFPSMPVDDLDQAPVAFTKVGKGFLGYVGDVNSEEESTAVVLAMLNLA
ncbi:hypothetical protein MMC19_002224 [Ptychographa xylographoides]|nr:hypothetical protein [Ptychographa xylographoides]